MENTQPIFVPAKNSREDQTIDLWNAAIESTVALDFAQGPGIPFIQFGRFLALADRIPLNLMVSDVSISAVAPPDHFR